MTSTTTTTGGRAFPFQTSGTTEPTTIHCSDKTKTTTTSGSGSGSAGAEDNNKDILNCNEYIKSGLNRDPTIIFLMERMINLGCKPPKGFISCIDCGDKPAGAGFGVLEETITTITKTHDDDNDDMSNNRSGTSGVTKGNQHLTKDSIRTRFNPLNFRANLKKQQQQQKQQGECDTTTILRKIKEHEEEEENDLTKTTTTTTKLRLLPEIFLCQQNLVNEQHAHQSMVHELIHAIDLCRTNMDPINNCIHMACTEIRAENLSGECAATREMVNGRISNFKGHGAQCVKRRAALSVKANPNCSDRAKDYVDAAFDKCFLDTFPFDRHPDLR